MKKDSQEEWHIAQKIRRPRKQREGKGEFNRAKEMGSRFGVLANVDVEGDNQEVVPNTHFTVAQGRAAQEILSEHNEVVRVQRGSRRGEYGVRLSLRESSNG